LHQKDIENQIAAIDDGMDYSSVRFIGPENGKLKYGADTVGFLTVGKQARYISITGMI
jgi:hypothetical protein